MSPRIPSPFLLCLAVPPLCPGSRLVGETPEEALRNAPKAIASILAEDLETHAKTVASREYGGRLTGTEGQIKTAAYFVERFRDLGLLPMGEEDEAEGKRSWYQNYKVTLRKVRSKESGLFQSVDGKESRFNETGAWFFRARSLDAEKPTLATGPLMFIGRGRKSDFTNGGFATEKNPGGKKLSGRIPVAALRIRSRKKKGNVYQAMFEGMSINGWIRGISLRVKAAGGTGFIVLMEKYKSSVLSYANQAGLYPGKPLVGLGWGRSRGAMDFMFRKPAVPALMLAGQEAKALIKKMKLDEEQAFGYYKNDRLDVDEVLGAESDEEFRIALASETEKTTASNVVGFLEGSDPELKKEAVVYSCHMDHLGLAADGGAYYGADDNGSGISTVLEIAEAFAKLQKDKRPKRSVLFLAVSGEELGLWGSAHYTKHPTWDLDRTILDINMDMLGRSTKKVPADTIALTPTYRHKAFNTTASDAAWLARAFGLKMANGDRFYARSDHFNFAKEDIPVVFFCDDEHVDYHMTTDTPDKLEYDKLEKVARLAFLIGYRAANNDRLPEKLGRQPGWFKDR